MSVEIHKHKMTDIRVELLNDPRQASEILSRDRLYAAYALGVLETESWASCTALMAYTDETAAAFSLLAQPFDAATTLFVIGDPEALGEIYRHPAASAVFAWVTAKDEHLDCLKKYWRLEEPERMLRMVVSRASFVPAENPAGAEVTQLSPSDHLALAEAYETAFGTPGAARLMARGPYYATWHLGRISSVAGTHLFARRFNLAAVGNVWTRPAYRGRGLAKLTVGAVTQGLLETCEEVVLNVREDNMPARRVYERLGYRTHCAFWQSRGRWRH